LSKELEGLLGLFPVLPIDITLSPSNRRRDNVLVVMRKNEQHKSTGIIQKKKKYITKNNTKKIGYTLGRNTTK